MGSELLKLDRDAALSLVGMTVEEAINALQVPPGPRSMLALWRAFEDLRRNDGVILKWEKGRLVRIEDPEKIARATTRGLRMAHRKTLRQAEKLEVAANKTKDDARARQLDRRAEKVRRGAALQRLAEKMTSEEAAAAFAFAASSPRGKPKG